MIEVKTSFECPLKDYGMHMTLNLISFLKWKKKKVYSKEKGFARREDPFTPEHVIQNPKQKSSAKDQRKIKRSK